MNVALELKEGLVEIGTALRRPELFATRWRDRVTADAGKEPTTLIFPLLVANAVVGLAVYGLSMGFHRDASTMLRTALFAPLAAGAAWTIALPALYIINSALGSRLDVSTTFLAALTTVSFGALAMLASVPVNWFFSLAVDDATVRVLVNLAVFSGVGVCMVDVFMRTMEALEPERSRLFALFWLGLVGVIGCELMYLVGLFAL